MMVVLPGEYLTNHFAGLYSARGEVLHNRIDNAEDFSVRVMNAKMRRLISIAGDNYYSNAYGEK